MWPRTSSPHLSSWTFLGFSRAEALDFIFSYTILLLVMMWFEWFERMRILKRLHVAIDGLLVRKGVSGVETTIYGLARAAAKHGACDYSFFLRKRSPLPDVRGENFRTIRCRIPFKWKLCRLFYQHVMLPKKVSQLSCDVLHCPGYLTPRRGKTPLVASIHDLIVFSHPELCRKSTVIHYRLQLPRTVKHADAIIVPSRHTRQALIDHFPEALEKVRVVPWGVDERFNTKVAPGEKECLSSTYRLPERFILFVGQIEPKKNVPGLLKAFKKLWAAGVDTHHLVIAGSQGWEPVDIAELAGELGIKDQVHLLGFVPQTDLPALYRAADIFVFPSFCEGFGLPPLEAMACGTPAIVSDRDSLPEVVGRTMPTYPPDDVSGWADELKKVINNREEQARMATVGIKQAAQFTWTGHMAKMEAVYAEVKGW